MIVEIQVLPTPPGTDASRYAHVDAAIAAIKASGIAYEVGPLGTWLEGDPDTMWQVIRSVHEASLTAGAESVVTVVKVAQSADADKQATALSLIAPHR